MADNVTKFTFLPLSKSFSSLENKDFQEYFLKWSIKNRIKASMFTFDQYFQTYEKEKFALDFFRDPNVISNIQIVMDSGKPTSLGTKADKVAVSQIPCTLLSMAFFDRMTEGEIANQSGSIKKCFDEFFGDFTVSDNLRQMILNEDSDVYCEYSESEREEFLFCLFCHICLGGRFCQFEDDITQYLDVTKAIYKDLISVQKNSETKELSIISQVFKVHCTDDHDHLYFPADSKHQQNFAYLIVDPLKRTVICLSHTFGACF